MEKVIQRRGLTNDFSSEAGTKKKARWFMRAVSIIESGVLVAPPTRLPLYISSSRSPKLFSVEVVAVGEGFN